MPLPRNVNENAAIESAPHVTQRRPGRVAPAIIGAFLQLAAASGQERAELDQLAGGLLAALCLWVLAVGRPLKCRGCSTAGALRILITPSVSVVGLITRIVARWFCARSARVDGMVAARDDCRPTQLSPPPPGVSNYWWRSSAAPDTILVSAATARWWRGFEHLSQTNARQLERRDSCRRRADHKRGLADEWPVVTWAFLPALT